MFQNSCTDPTLHIGGLHIKIQERSLAIKGARGELTRLSRSCHHLLVSFFSLTASSPTLSTTMSGQGRPGDVLEITVLKKQPRSDEALLLLKKIASVSSHCPRVNSM